MCGYCVNNMYMLCTCIPCVACYTCSNSAYIIYVYATCLTCVRHVYYMCICYTRIAHLYFYVLTLHNSSSYTLVIHYTIGGVITLHSGLQIDVK